MALSLAVGMVVFPQGFALAQDFDDFERDLEEEARIMRRIACIQNAEDDLRRRTQRNEADFDTCVQNLLPLVGGAAAACFRALNPFAIAACLILETPVARAGASECRSDYDNRLLENRIANEDALFMCEGI